MRATRTLAAGLRVQQIWIKRTRKSKALPVKLGGQWIRDTLP